MPGRWAGTTPTTSTRPMAKPDHQHVPLGRKRLLGPRRGLRRLSRHGRRLRLRHHPPRIPPRRQPPAEPLVHRRRGRGHGRRGRRLLRLQRQRQHHACRVRAARRTPHGQSKTYADWTCKSGLYCEVAREWRDWANTLWDVRERFRTDLVRGSQDSGINEVHQLYIDSSSCRRRGRPCSTCATRCCWPTSARNPGTGPGGSEEFLPDLDGLRRPRTRGQGALDTAGHRRQHGGGGLISVPAECPQPIGDPGASTDGRHAAEAGARSRPIVTVTRDGATPSARP